jgi:hypothetical protein
MAVNVSARQFHSASFVDEVISARRNRGEPATQTRTDREPLISNIEDDIEDGHPQGQGVCFS